MWKAEDLTGQRFGKVTVLSRVANNKHGRAVWLCKCDCGNEKEIPAANLKSGRTTSCGCYSGGLKRKTGTHGMTNTRIFHEWQSMLQRCNNPNNQRYEDYGGRGIKVCDEWIDNFVSFYEWSMDNGYDEILTLDRKDVDGDYSPDNCRWVTNLEQQSNKRNNRVIECNGEKYILNEWARITGLNAQTIAWRIDRGWSVEEALYTPSRKQKVF